MRTHSALLVALLAGAALTAGCDRNDDRTSRNDADSTVVSSNDRAVEAGRATRDAAGNAASTVGDKTRDAAITAEINARLVADRDLSALGINVDTTDGRVKLRGTAPDDAARSRATALARGVDGVVGVNNELQLRPRN